MYDYSYLGESSTATTTVDAATSRAAVRRHTLNILKLDSDGPKQARQYIDRSTAVVPSCSNRLYCGPSQIGEPETSLRALFKKIGELRKLEHDWNGYGSEPPNLTAESHAQIVVDCLFELDISPERIIASAENGIGIYVKKAKRYAIIECLNDGEIVIGLSDRQGHIKNRELTPEYDDVRESLEWMSEFLDAE